MVECQPVFWAPHDPGSVLFGLNVFLIFFAGMKSTT
jgi:hypothetical protein